MPNSQLFSDSSSKYKLSSLLRHSNLSCQSGSHASHNQHSKYIQVAGRGGLDHGHTSATYSWNRKGRW